MEPKGWEVSVISCGVPATSQRLSCVTRVISATRGWRSESPLPRDGDLRCLYLLVVMRLFRPRANSCPSKAGGGALSGDQFLEVGLISSVVRPP